MNDDDASAGGRELVEQHDYYTPSWVQKPLLLDQPAADESEQQPDALIPTSGALALRRSTLPRQLRPTYDDDVVEEQPSLAPEVIAEILAPRVPAGFAPKAPEVESQPVRTEGRWLQQRSVLARMFGAKGVRVTLEGTALTVVQKGRHTTVDLSDPLQVGDYGRDTSDPAWSLELRPSHSAEPVVLDRDQIEPAEIVPVLDHHQAVAWARLEDRIARYGR